MSQTDNFSIVVLGGMNPRVHHPFFYQSLGILNEAQVKTAVEAATTMCMPQIAQLDIEDMRIICLPDRWQIASPNEVRAARLLEIAGGVMTALDHTPTGAIGFNFDFVRASGRQDTEPHFSGLARSLRLGLGDAKEEDASASFSYVARDTEPEAKRVASVHVAPVADPADHVLVKNNFNYQITLTGKFDLGPVLRARYERDHRAAQGQLERTLDSLKAVH